MDLMLHVEDGLRRFPDKAEPLVAAGMFYELLGSAAVELPAKKAQSRIDWSGLTMTSAFPTAGEEQYLPTLGSKANRSHASGDVVPASPRCR